MAGTKDKVTETIYVEIQPSPAGRSFCLHKRVR